VKTNIIINDDAIKAMKNIKDNSIDLIFADPPYWMRTDGELTRVEGTKFDGVYEEWDKFESLEEYEQFTRNWLTEVKRILKKDGSFWVIGGMQCIYTVGSLMHELGFWIINDVIWQKSNPTPNFKGTRLRNSHETLIWATKSKNSKYHFNYKTAKELNFEDVDSIEFNKGKRIQMGSIWKFPVCSGNERLKDSSGNKLHSTQKPETLLYRILAINTQENDIVLDPFAGTMTTAAVAKKMGRHFIMIENDGNYCAYGKKRLDNIVPYIGDIEKAIYDIKPPKVTMEEMILSGYFYENEKFFFKNSDEYAKLTKKGKLIYNNELLDMHTCAAVVSGRKAKRLNGFSYWYVLRNDERVSIEQIRLSYRKKLEII